MALPASGNSISLDQIHVELGESSGTTVALGDTDVRNLASDTSGAIAMNQFFGLSNTLDITSVFKTKVYTGNSSTQDINTGLNMQSNHGLVIVRRADQAGGSSGTYFADTVIGRNASNVNTRTGQNFSGRGFGFTATANRDLTTWNTNGFGVGQNYNMEINRNGSSHCSWTFLENEDFFDIVTYTGTGHTNAQAVSHSLSSTPGMIIVKNITDDSEYVVWHSGDDSTTQGYYVLGGNDFGTAGRQTSSLIWGNTAPTSSVFTVKGRGSFQESRPNEDGKDYVAYIFADTDKIIKCGKIVHNSSSTDVDVGFDNGSSFVMLKGISGSSGSTDIEDRWNIFDTEVNGIVNNDDDHILEWSRSFDPETDTDRMHPLSSGFQITGMPQDTYLYMAIAAGS